MKKIIITLVIVVALVIGYISVNHKSDVINSNIPQFSQVDMQQGWYYGYENQKKPGTPPNWKHTGDDTRSSQWYDPTRR
jgi:hypothetical protein